MSYWECDLQQRNTYQQHTTHTPHSTVTRHRMIWRIVQDQWRIQDFMVGKDAPPLPFSSFPLPFLLSSFSPPFTPLPFLPFPSLPFLYPPLPLSEIRLRGLGSTKAPLWGRGSPACQRISKVLWWQVTKLICCLLRLLGATRLSPWPNTVRVVCGWPCGRYQPTRCYSSLVCQWHTVVPGGKVIVGLMSYWPCITDIVVYPSTGSTAKDREMSEHPRICPFGRGTIDLTSGRAAMINQLWLITVINY